MVEDATFWVVEPRVKLLCRYVAWLVLRWVGRAVARLARARPRGRELGPVDGAIFPLNGLVVFSGSASDLEDGGLPGSSLEWSSDRDGALGTGSQVSTFNLSAGEHRITLRATDSDGMSSEKEIQIGVDPNVVRWRPDGSERMTVEALLRDGVVPTGGDPDRPVITGRIYLLLAAIVTAVVVGTGLIVLAFYDQKRKLF